MKKTEFIFGTYNGLPYGSTDVEFEHAYQRAYKPFLTTLYKYPMVSATIYYSGILLTWLQEHHPEFLMLLNDMVKRNQIELLGGAFHEPILPLIPASDRSGQIELLTTYLRRRFGKRPRGIWLPEMAWEPSLPVSLKNCGMEYTFLDSESFNAADISQKNQYKSYRTEDQGKSLEVFAVQSSNSPARFINGESGGIDTYMKKLLSAVPSDEESIVTVFDEGEALGLWENFDVLYKEPGWLASWFEHLSDPECRLETILPKEFARRPHRSERCYFGCTRIKDFAIWWSELELDRDKQSDIRKRERQLLPEGSLRQVVKRYAESAALYAKAMHVHILVNQIRGDRYRKKAAREELWKGQSGYALWHGKFDGILRNSIRKAAYSSLIEAEKIARERGIFKQYVGREDIDLDGLDEYLFMGNQLNAYVHTFGGTLFELDYLPCSWNYLDTMARYEEPYHGTLVNSYTYDARPRYAFTDAVIPKSAGFGAFIDGSLEEIDPLKDHTYQVADYRRDHMEMALSTTWNGRLEVKKRFSLIEDTLMVSYTLKNIGEDSRITDAFYTELNLSFASNNEEFLQIRAYDDQGKTFILREARACEDIVSFSARDMKNAVSIDVTFDFPCALWSQPIVSKWFSRNGIKNGYQASSFGIRRQLSLEPGETIVHIVRMKLSR